MSSLVVIQKALASAGVASRRAAEKLVAEGRVTVNGRKVWIPGTKVDPARDVITVNGKRVRAQEAYVYYALNKPKGVLSAAKDKRGGKTVVSLIKTKTRIMPAGRLDRDTSGLMLLTNDGDLIYEVTHPKFEHEKEYEALVQIPHRWQEADLKQVIKKLERGIKIAGGFKTSPAKVAVLEKVSNDRFRVSVTIHEGKKHQVRQMIAGVGMSVVALKRVRIGTLKLGTLSEGAYRELTKEEIQDLKSNISG